MRANVNIYRKGGDQSETMSEAGDDDAERAPEIPIEELLEGLTLGSQGNSLVKLNAERAIQLANEDGTDDDRSDILSEAPSDLTTGRDDDDDFDDAKSDISLPAAPVAPARKKGPAGAAAAKAAAAAASSSSSSPSDLVARKAAFAKPAPSRKGGRK